VKPVIRAYQLYPHHPLCCRVISGQIPFLPQEETVTSHQLLRLKQVEDKTGLKRSQIYLYMKIGDFPRSIKIGPASVAWLESEIDEWINLKLTNR
jgi:prophage regulatory protein